MTELTDLDHDDRDDLDDRDEGRPEGYLTFERDARLFVHDSSLEERLKDDLLAVTLAPDEIYQAPLPADLAVRLGKLRVSEYLADGREVTRAVLQAGSVLRTRGSDSGSTAYHLNRVLLMALGEGEIWVFPAGKLPEHKS